MTQRPWKNLHACLVHDAVDCLYDLVANLQIFDPESDILLYDGSGGQLGLEEISFEGAQPLIFPKPRKQEWGKTHRYILDSLDYSLSDNWDAVTLVDSDQLLCSPGYTKTLQQATQVIQNLGVSAPWIECASSIDDPTQFSPVLCGAIETFPHHPELIQALRKHNWDGSITWNFNPSTVYFREAIQALFAFLDEHPGLRDEIEHGPISVGEEIYLSSIIAALGFKVVDHPFQHNVRWRDLWNHDDIAWMIRGDSVWIHPVPRDLNDYARCMIRGYREAMT